MKNKKGFCSFSLCVLHKKSLGWSFCVFLVCGFLNLVVTDVSFADLPTLTISLSSNTISLNIVAQVDSGTFADSGSISVSANTNNYSGYTLSINSSYNDAPLIGPLSEVSGAYQMLDSIGTVSGVTSSGISADAFSNSSNTQYNHTWGYKPSKRNSSNNTNFLPAPSTSGDMLDATSGLLIQTRSIVDLEHIKCLDITM